jgi:tetratricopeptide (TPR) repeat protein
VQVAMHGSIRDVLVLAAVLAATARSGAALDPPKPGEVWHRVAIGDIVVVSNAEPAVVEEVAGNLAAVRPALARASGLKIYAPVTTTAYVFRSGSSFRPYRDAVLGRKSESSAVFLQLRDGNLLIVDGSRLDEALPVPYRTLADSYLGSSVPGLPPWVREGLAELFSTMVRSATGVTVGGPIAEHLRLLQAQPPIPVGALLAARSSTPELAVWTRHGVFAAESWAVGYTLLLGGEGRRGRLPRYLELLGEGGSVESCLAAAFGTNPGELERELQATIRSKLPPVVTLASRDLDVPTVAEPAQIPRDELLFLLGNLLVHARPANTADAEAFLTEAISINPSLAPAYTMRAIIQTRLGLDEAAAADLEKGVSLESGDPRPTLFYADFLAERLTDRVRRGGKASAEELARIRDLYRRSLALDPQRSRAWAGLGFTYLLAETDSADGIAALERCLELEPAHVDAAFNLVLLYARSGRRDDAAALIERVVRHGPDRALERAARDGLLVADLRHADQLVADGKSDVALGILERVSAEAGNDRLRSEAARRIEAARRAVAIARQAARFDEALAAIRARDYQGAMAILKELEPVAIDPDLLQAIADTESDILPFLQPRR